MNVYDFSVRTIHGDEKLLADYRGSVLLIVNTATKCGFAPQLKELQELYGKYQDEGLTVLGFPCNQFREQEPGSNSQVEQACRMHFGVSFPLFAKIDVNGPDAHPLYKYLKQAAPGWFGSRIKWNFTKFLIDSQGNVIKRYAPAASPRSIEKHIRKLLERSGSSK